MLIRSPWFSGLLTWSSEASEFEAVGLPLGLYRTRALDLFGRVTFGSGAWVGAEHPQTAPTRLWAKVDLDEPDSREVKGFVRWETGAPAVKAVVFMQNEYDFRKYVRRVETDEHGYFVFSDVPAREPYFVFALPPGVGDAMRRFDHFGVGYPEREVWRALALSPHRVIGAVPQSAAFSEGTSTEPTQRVRGGPARGRSTDADILAADVQLVRLDGQGESIVWTVRAADAGRFSISNVFHGRYQVRVWHDGGKTVTRSLPFEVGDGQTETTVRWAEP